MSLNLGTMFAAVALDSSNFRNGLSALPGISWRCHKCEESSVGSCFHRTERLGTDDGYRKTNCRSY